MPPEFVTILGVRFFGGTVEEAVERMERGGLLVVPAAPALKDIDCNAAYREALSGCRSMHSGFGVHGADLEPDLEAEDSQAFRVEVPARVAAQRRRTPAGQRRVDHGRSGERTEES